MLIDAHSHFLPPEALDYLVENKEFFKTDLIQLGEKQFMRFAGGGMHPVNAAFTDMQQRIADMDERGVDKSVISVSPALFYYEVEAEAANRLAQICNDYAYAMAQKYPDRIEAMATVPLQNMDMAIAEMERAHTKLGMNSVEIAAIVPGIMPDDPYMMPFYEYCEKQNILIFLHPTFTGVYPPYDKYYNMNLIGYVQETNWALNRLILGGVFERFSNLHILACHGGGQFPYQFGRMIHCWEVRPEAKVACPKSPENYLKNIYYDTVTHWTKPLQFLIDAFGKEQVLCGTDYPYDMADNDPAGTLRQLNLEPAVHELIAHKTCEALLGK